MQTPNVAEIAGEPPPASGMVVESAPAAWPTPHATLDGLILAEVGCRARISVSAGMLGPHTFPAAAIFNELLTLPRSGHSSCVRTPSEKRSPKPHSSSSGSGEVTCVHCTTAPECSGHPKVSF